ncbi:AP2 domain-containing protein [Listeria seeligeri]|uniref:AP2 domain-containing protein n=1 Tax=Listeria seeligeri TaxID=1640 RepID=UPI001887D50E|nr:AP2 domain-containing protein [Listeria seeligeri]MBF2551593.1 AP2 domain-containing protein [Listeria seeligeri]
MSAKKYNKLTIIKDTGKRTKSGNAIYECRCDCGNTCEITLAKLRSGHTKSCGCLIKDTANEKFKKYEGIRKNRLTLIRDTGKRTNDGKRIVLCQCECGNTCEVVFAKFNNSSTKSCGCLALEKKKEKHEKGRAEKAVKTLQDKKILINGTNVAVINSHKLRSNNTSGKTGVTFDSNRKKWIAQIVFQDKSMRLGRFVKKEDAIKARLEAEEKYFKPVIEKNKR